MKIENKTNCLNRIVLKLIDWYQKWLSPMLSPSCRFVPSCSEYGRIAVQARGAFRGGWLVLKRLARCHPFRRGGWDPVPFED